jgi:hypothetical protein
VVKFGFENAKIAAEQKKGRFLNVMGKVVGMPINATDQNAGTTGFSRLRLSALRFYYCDLQRKSGNLFPFFRLLI